MDSLAGVLVSPYARHHLTLEQHLAEPGRANSLAHGWEMHRGVHGSGLDLCPQDREVRSKGQVRGDRFGMGEESEVPRSLGTET